MVLVTPDVFLNKVAELYTESKTTNGSVAITCKSVLAIQVDKRIPKKKAIQMDNEERVLLFRACKYGNNKHKKKYSTTVTALNHAGFHARLSQILKTKIDVSPKTVVDNGTSKKISKEG